MADPNQLTLPMLLQGIEETEQALERGRKLIEKANLAGFAALVESAAKLIQKLEEELADFRTAIAEKLDEQ